MEQERPLTKKIDNDDVLNVIKKLFLTGTEYHGILIVKIDACKIRHFEGRRGYTLNDIKKELNKMATDPEHCDDVTERACARG